MYFWYYVCRDCGANHGLPIYITGGIKNMYSDYINLMDENYRLRDANEKLVNSILEHAQLTNNPTDLDKQLWDAIGLIVYSDEDKERLDKTVSRMETFAQIESDGYI